jgi:AI-2 transport protein TqsA
MASPDRKIVDYLLIAASLVVVIAGIRAAEAVVVPLLLAIFIVVIASTPLLWLERRGMPVALAILIVMGGIVLILVGISVLIGSSIQEFNARLPSYQIRIRELVSQGIELLEGYGVDVPPDFQDDWLNVGRLMGFVGATLTGLGGVLSNSLLILITVIFMLLEISSFPNKLRAILSNPEESMRNFDRFAHTVNRYVATKTSVSVMTGLLAAILCVWIDIDFPLLWGLVAFLLNYIPTIGSLVAAVPPVILAALQVGPSWAFVLALGYLAINNVLGNFLEPRLQGRNLGISPLVVFLSLVFWGWMLGPVGMLLSVPLTMTIIIAMGAHPKTYWIAVLLGPEKPVAPPHWDGFRKLGAGDEPEPAAGDQRQEG